MKNRFFTKSRPAMRLLTIAVICSMLPWGTAWGGFQPPLGQVPNPVFASQADGTPNGTLAAPLKPFIKDTAAAIRLGKALFWDSQVGSDGETACATCHFHAGADKRLTNQINPGPDGVFTNISTGTTFKTLGPNYTLDTTALGDFPFFQLNPPGAQLVDLTTPDPLTGLIIATVRRSVNDVVGSQGVRKTRFDGIVAGSAVDSGTIVADNVFKDVNGANTRQVTGRNSPSVINAVFNFSNFWDGRANNIFNGENPFGPLDPNAGVYNDNGGNTPLEKRTVAIPNSSLASQATGPPLSDVEMSFAGRTFPELGKKMLDPALTPLGQQLVHPDDGVLGTIANSRNNPTAKGLNTSYKAMIEAAFQNNLWNSSKKVTLPGTVGGQPAQIVFTQMEANFPLFWGLAIQLYEATLVSDRAPFDRFQAGNLDALSPVAQKGATTFDEKCAVCHSGSALTNATVGSSLPTDNPVVFTNNTTHNLIQQGQTNVAALTDTGFFNIGVRPTADDPGRGGTAPNSPNFTNPLTGQPFPLSFTALAGLRAQTLLDFVTPKLPPFTPVNSPVAVGGSFKTAGLRNVELTAPYFHNGSMFSLVDVVAFYARGGNFSNPEFAGAMAAAASGKLRGAGGSDVVQFLMALTDERVRNEQAPFDHPELLIPSGDLADSMSTLLPTGGAPAPVPVLSLGMNPVPAGNTLTTLAISGPVDSTATVTVTVNNQSPAVATVTAATWSYTATGLTLGANTIKVTATSPTGVTKTIDPTTVPPTPVINVLPVAIIGGTPQIVTKVANATLTVGGNGVATYQYTVDGGAPSTDIPVATPITLTNLPDGTHTVAVLGKDATGNLQQPPANPTTVTWTVKANPPLLTINPLSSPAKGPVLKIGGTTDLGVIPVVRADTAVTVGPVTNVSGSWSCQVSGLKSGVTNFTVTASDIALNVASKMAAVTIVLPDGNMKGTGSADITDAVRALRIAVGLAAPSADEMLRGDVAPLVGGVPAPDDRIDIGDALVILRKVVGLVKF